jgi:hypothetical protein
MVRKLSVTLGLLLCAGALCAPVSAAAASSISGTVTAATTQAPLAEVVVCAESVGVTDVFECGATGSDGTYVVAGLEGGNYKVEFSPSIMSGYLPQYYNGGASGEQADLVAVVEGLDAAGIDAALAAEIPSGGGAPAGSGAVPPVLLPSVPQVALPFALASKPKPILSCRKGWRKVRAKGKQRCRKIARQQRPGGTKRAA